jgi:hypothetical protein
MAEREREHMIRDSSGTYTVPCTGEDCPLGARGHGGIEDPATYTDPTGPSLADLIGTDPR